jgi:hypothetical protein
MDLGDWQELSRLRFENHVWHRCLDDIREAMEQPGATSESIAHAVRQSVDVLNDRLVSVHRRRVARAVHA